MIPTCEPYITPEDIAAVEAAMRAGHIAVGPEVEAFEQAVAEYTRIPYAVACSSGSAAIFLALKAVGVRPGLRVTVPTLTFASAAEAIIHCGAEPEFVDHGEPSFLSLNFYGHPPIEAGTVEDCCEGLGSQPFGRAAVTCLSFNGNKIITAAGGGMVLTRDAAIAERVRRLMNHQRVDGIEWVHAGVGYNFALSAMQAALGLSQMGRLDEHIRRKRLLWDYYLTALPSGIEVWWPNAGTNYWMPLILLDRPARPVIDFMRAEGVIARPVWTPLHTQEPYRRFKAGKCDVAKDLHRRGLLLPCSVGITEAEREQVLAALRRALDRGTSAPAPAS